MTTEVLFGPGSEKGFLLIGAVLASKVKDKLKNVKHYAGVSVGSILATFLAFGLTLPEIIFESVTFNLFDSWVDVLKDFDFLSWWSRSGQSKTFGLIDPSRIKERIEFWMFRKFGQPMTFLDLYLRTGIKLTIVVTDRSNIDEPKPIYYDYIETPHYSISDAVLHSCMLPGIFENKNPNRLDGAFSDPLPIERMNFQNSEVIVFLLRDSWKLFDSSLPSMIADIYFSLMVPSQILLNEKIKKHKDSVKIICLTRESNGWRVPLSIQRQEKFSMISQGFLQALNEL
jgi:predicted acylesterase/phospholipase RssA